MHNKSSKASVLFFVFILWVGANTLLFAATPAPGVAPAAAAQAQAQAQAITAASTAAAPAKPATPATGWDSISIDGSAGEDHPYYGKGVGITRNEAEQGAQKSCHKVGGKQCKIVLSFQQCGAYAASARSTGKGTGTTKQIAEAQAISDCHSIDCKIIVSDCAV